MLQAIQDYIHKRKGWGHGKKTNILIEPNKIILARWVNRALNQALILKHHIKVYDY